MTSTAGSTPKGKRLLDGRTSEAAFFGRHQERERLRRLAEETQGGQSSMVVVSGPAGIGKTSLVRRFIGDVEADIGTVVVMRCSEFDAVPHEPLGRLTAMTGRPVTGFDRGASAEPPPGAGAISGSSDRQAAAALVTDVLDAISGPTLLVVDDLHWAGRPVLDAIELLVIELSADPGRGVMVVLVTRPLPPGHATAARLARLEREALLPRLALGPIDAATNADLVRSRLPAATPALVGYVHRSAAGNPLLALDTADLLQRRGIAPRLEVADPRAWAAHVPDPLGHDPLAAWLAEQPHELTRLCGLAAAIGGDFDLGDAELVAGARDRADTDAARAEVTELLRAAVDRQVLGADDRWFWFRDGAVRDQLYRTLSTADRQAAHGRMAAGLLERSARDVTSRIGLGHHLLASGQRLGDVPGAVDALVDGARAACDLRSWDDAGRFFEAHLALAAECAPGPVDGPAERAAQSELLVEVGLAHGFNGEHRGASSRLSEAVDLAAESGDVRLWARALVALLRIETAADPDALSEPVALPALDSFLDRVDDPAARALVLAGRAEALVVAGRVDDGEHIADQALQLALTSDEPSVAAPAERALGAAAQRGADPVAAIERFERSRRLAVDAGDWFAADTIAARLALAHLSAGELGRAVEWGEKARSEAAHNRDVTNEALSDSVLGMTAQLQGDFTSARRHLDLAASRARRAVCAPAQLYATSAEVLCLLAVDDRARAARTLAAAANPLPAVTRALWVLVDGHGAAGLGDLPQALVDPLLGAAAAALLVASTESGVDTTPWIELLETAIAAGDELAAALPIPLRRALAVALAAGSRLDAALVHLEAAEERWRREGGYSELVEVLIAGAEVNGTLGRRDRAEQQASEADRLAERLGMPRARRRARQLHQLGHTTPPHEPGGVDGVILMSDVVGSTTVSSQHGDQAYYDLVMDHHQVVRRRLADHGGVEFSEGGDSLFAWFVSPEDAIECAVAIQRDAARLRRAGRPLSIRIGVAGGQPFFSDGRPYGSVVNRAAGLNEKARPHEIVVDETMLARIGPVVADFTTRSAELKAFGRLTIGVLEPADLGPAGGS